MTDWPASPTLYEINTRPWLHALSRRLGRPVTLADVPAAEWDALAAWGFDAVWLMGVWERSPQSQAIARAHPGLQLEYHRALPDFSPEDVIGSPYAVHRYVADGALGGPEGLAAARSALAARGLRLVLDYVPNHVARDHPWLAEHPEYFIRGKAADLKVAPGDYFKAEGGIFAHGRDPYFPGWTDTAQLNAFHPGLRQAAIATLAEIGSQCDGVRVDMAMLLLRRIFAATWGARAGKPPRYEFWWEVIRAARAVQPNLLFIAEAYWDLEWELQQQGFDYCYDKRLYDRLAHDGAAGVRGHLAADLSYQRKLVRFVENHDEPRAAAIFTHPQERAAALLAATLPGARLFHDGQLEGARIKLPVQLGRRHPEPVDAGLSAFYRTLLAELRHPVFHTGEWHLCEVSGWPDNPTHANLVAWCWADGSERRLVVVNLSDGEAQGRVHLPWPDLAGSGWALRDPFSGDRFDRDGDELCDPGLYVGLKPYGWHFLAFEKEYHS